MSREVEDVIAHQPTRDAPCRDAREVLIPAWFRYARTALVGSRAVSITHRMEWTMTPSEAASSSARETFRYWLLVCALSSLLFVGCQGLNSWLGSVATTSNLEGTISLRRGSNDPDTYVHGAHVVLMDVNKGAEHATTTSADGGRYVFKELPPGKYLIGLVAIPAIPEYQVGMLTLPVGGTLFCHPSPPNGILSKGQYKGSDMWLSVPSNREFDLTAGVTLTRNINVCAHLVR